MFKIKNIFLHTQKRKFKMSTKLFKCAGVSKRNGAFKARFASDMTRVKVLAKTGSSDIDLIELKEPMTKEDAIAYLLKINFDNGNALIRTALEEGLEKRLPSAKAPKATKSKPSLDAIAARGKVAKSKAKSTAVTQPADTELDDKPFGFEKEAV